MTKSIRFAGYNSERRSSGIFIGLTYSDLKLLADYQSAKEQTAIRAGAGGFDIVVSGHTELKGAVLASTADASVNRLVTQTLGFSDLINMENTEGAADTLSLQYSSAGTGLGGSSYGAARIDHWSVGHTKAAVAPALAFAQSRRPPCPGCPLTR